MACAVLTLSEEECQKMFNEKQSVLLARYKLGARRSLKNARFLLSSNFVVLQAFVLYLVRYHLLGFSNP